MWWIVAFVVVGFGLFVFVKRARAEGAHRALVIAGQNQVRVTFAYFSDGFPTEYDRRVWSDPYLLGYVQGSVTLIARLIDGSLRSEQRGLVFVDVLRGMIPDSWQQVCEHTSRLHDARDPEFLRGGMDGMNVVALSMNRLRPEALAEPDIQTALAQAPATERLVGQIFGESETAETAFSAAGAALMATYMERHREAAGY